MSILLVNGQPDHDTIVCSIANILSSRISAVYRDTVSVFKQICNCMEQTNTIYGAHVLNIPPQSENWSIQVFIQPNMSPNIYRITVNKLNNTFETTIEPHSPYAFF